MNPSRKEIKAVLFDFGGVLDADGLALKDQFYPLYRSANLPWTRAEFERHFFASDDLLTGRLRKETYSQTIALQVAGVLKHGKVYSKPLAQEIVQSYLDQAHDCIRKNVPTLEKLHAKYKLGLVSNFYGNLPAVIRDLGLERLFEVVIDSELVGAKKPHPPIFFAALEKLGLAPHQAVFVGDSPPRDLAGAKALGMRHVRLIHPDRRKPLPCCPGDPIIRSLKELERILR